MRRGEEIPGEAFRRIRSMGSTFNETLPSQVMLAVESRAPRRMSWHSTGGMAGKVARDAPWVKVTPAANRNATHQLTVTYKLTRRAMTFNNVGGKGQQTCTMLLNTWSLVLIVVVRQRRSKRARRQHARLLDCLLRCFANS
jgi:hypothetical protein